MRPHWRPLLGRRARGPSGAAALLDAARREFLSPRRLFGPSAPVDRDVFRTTAGVYLRIAQHLLVAQHLADDEPVHAVGWARNDYWAVRIWSGRGHDFRNDYDAEATGAPAPSLAAVGWPHPLTYATTLTRAKERALTPVMVTAGYRVTDGSFRAHTIAAAERTRFYYEHPDPGPEEVAVAVELGLGGRRWRRHLAEISAINDENRRNGVV